jgi:hypothetical protein
VYVYVCGCLLACQVFVVPNKYCCILKTEKEKKKVYSTCCKVDGVSWGCCLLFVCLAVVVAVVSFFENERKKRSRRPYKKMILQYRIFFLKFEMPFAIRIHFLVFSFRDHARTHYARTHAPHIQ